MLEDAGLGDSISVNGCCLTVADATASTWTADVMQETLDKTSLYGVRPGDRVNLERAVTADKRLGGHIVQGHVDGVGTVVRRTPSEHWEVVEISLPAELAATSSTRARSPSTASASPSSRPGTDRFTVCLIPETLARTTLGTRQPGDRVNLEVDVIAKYVERLLPYTGRRTHERPRVRCTTPT